MLIFESLIDSLTELNVLTGERQRGESWALENVLNPISGSQGQTVCSPSFPPTAATQKSKKKINKIKK